MRCAQLSRSPQMCLAPTAIGSRLLLSGDTMTTIKHKIRTVDVKREVRDIRETARKIGATKASARRFLLSIGMYSANGQLKPQFR
jgi:hypothetical protein